MVGERPQQKDRKFIRMTLAEAQALMLGKSKQQVWVDIEEYMSGYVIPPQLLGLMSDNTGTLKRDYRIGDLRYGTNTSTAAGGATLAVPTGKIWDVLAIFASADATSDVADRTCSLLIPDLGFTGALTAAPTTYFAAATWTMSADQTGAIYWFKGEDVSWTNDNGTIARAEDDMPRSLWMYAGGDIFSKITANKAANDNQGLELIYYEYDAVTST